MIPRLRVTATGGVSFHPILKRLPLFHTRKSRAMIATCLAAGAETRDPSASIGVVGSALPPASTGGIPPPPPSSRRLAPLPASAAIGLCSLSAVRRSLIQVRQPAVGCFEGLQFPILHGLRPHYQRVFPNSNSTSTVPYRPPAVNRQEATADVSRPCADPLRLGGLSTAERSLEDWRPTVSLHLNQSPPVMLSLLAPYESGRCPPLYRDRPCWLAANRAAGPTIP